MPTPHRSGHRSTAHTTWLALLLISILSCGLTGCNPDTPERGDAWRTRLYRLFASDRPRGVDPPPAGTDAIPGLDIRHPRPAPPVLDGVTPGELVLVPAGPFWMGNNSVPDERPRHRRVLPAYRIEKTEVSTGQFRRFVESGGYDDRRSGRTKGGHGKSESARAR